MEVRHVVICKWSSLKEKAFAERLSNFLNAGLNAIPRLVHWGMMIVDTSLLLGYDTGEAVKAMAACSL